MGVCVRVVVSCVVCGLCRGVWCAVCGVVWCRGLLCVRDALCACCVRVGVRVGVCGVWSCVVCVVWCLWLCVVWCLLWCGTLKTSVCAFNTSPCVRSKRSHVYRQHAHMFKNVWACCRYTRGHFERTHGDVLNAHTEEERGGGERKGEAGHRQFCSPKWPT